MTFSNVTTSTWINLNNLIVLTVLDDRALNDCSSNYSNSDN